MSFFISQAYADGVAAGTAQTSQAPSPWINLVLLGGMVVVFYFLLWRPQSKRQKEHQNLVGSLSKGDEVVTNGGLLGKITKVNDNFITIEIANNIEVNVQKASITAALPKGTIKAL